MITRKRDVWFKSDDCKVNEIIRYIEKNDFMRDAQIEAIKTYLFLKIACDNKQSQCTKNCGASTAP